MSSTRVPVYIDDADNRILYESSGHGSVPWHAATEQNLLANEWNETAHVTNQVNATARFTFRGSRVQVYGTLDRSGGSSSYIVLGGEQQTTNHPKFSTLYSFQFFDSGDLPFADHTLVITNTGPKGNLRLDYLEIMTDPSVKQPNPSTAPETGLASSTKKGLSGGAVAAIVLSIIGFMIALGVATWIIWRCRRIKRLRRMSMRKGFEIETDDDQESQISMSSTSDLRQLIKMKTFKKPKVPISQGTTTTTFTSVVLVYPIPPSSNGSSTAGASSQTRVGTAPGERPTGAR